MVRRVVAEFARAAVRGRSEARAGCACRPRLGCLCVFKKGGQEGRQEVAVKSSLQQIWARHDHLFDSSIRSHQGDLGPVPPAGLLGPRGPLFSESQQRSAQTRPRVAKSAQETACSRPILPVLGVKGTSGETAQDRPSWRDHFGLCRDGPPRGDPSRRPIRHDSCRPPRRTERGGGSGRTPAKEPPRSFPLRRRPKGVPLGLGCCVQHPTPAPRPRRAISAERPHMTWFG